MTPVATMLARLRHFLRGLFRRDQVESELRRELDGCVEMLVAEKVADGMSPQEARRAARLEFGRVDQVAERVRDVRPGAWIEQTVREIQRCIRSLARSPGFTLIVVLTLGVGIGANAATFSFIHAMMLLPMPFPDADRLVAVQETSPRGPCALHRDRKAHLQRGGPTPARLDDAARRVGLGNRAAGTQRAPGDQP